jgi:uncharacterized protein (TIGR02145 family)
MNKKKPIWLYTISLLGFILFSTVSCKKNDDSNPEPDAEIPVILTSAIFNTNLTYGELTDQEGNTYKTIKIGTQTWMAENLRTTIYRNGEPIQLITNDVEWTKLTDGAYCNYSNTNNLDTIVTYGRYYNWYAVKSTRNLAPNGWHVPSDAEWITLINFLGGESIAGGKMKETGVTHWLSPNAVATNTSGFTGLPGSYRGSIYGIFYQMDGMSYWWSSTEANSTESYGLSLDYSTAKAILGYSFKKDGFAIRCIKD